MKALSLLKNVQRYAINNSPTLLTAFGITGTLATAYLTGKATFKAAEIIREEETRRELLEPAILVQLPPLDKKEKTRLVWKEFIPPAVTVVTTVGCMVAANSISASRMAALAAAYKLSDKNFNEYKDKVKEVLGEKKEGEIREAVAQDAVDRLPFINIERGHGGDTICLDKWTGRYFKSDMQTIRAAENDLNKGLYKGNDRVVTLGDFYQALGLSVPGCAEEVGWNADSAIDLIFPSVVRDGTPVLVMDFANTPFPIKGIFGTA